MKAGFVSSRTFAICFLAIAVVSFISWLFVRSDLSKLIMAASFGVLGLLQAVQARKQKQGGDANT